MDRSDCVLDRESRWAGARGRSWSAKTRALRVEQCCNCVCTPDQVEYRCFLKINGIRNIILLNNHFRYLITLTN
jgi:hypothetical protein